MSPLSFPAASPGDTGASAGEEQRAQLGLQNTLVLSKLGERAQVGEQPRTLCCRDTSLHGRPSESHAFSLSCRFCAAPRVRAHLQSAQREQRRDLAVSRGGPAQVRTHLSRGAAMVPGAHQPPAVQ